ncbi:signal transduction histidine-protein kinase BaeS [Klebsiella pneumoniae]|uniref:histidine kinase n=1 Tax=Klebsiella pneumoniae TaxID=573 RepID=A0A2X1QLH0_KLEPN|nr:signal transduction histidine-protein kinase BaeS [Klebsiella pneumoniae]
MLRGELEAIQDGVRRFTPESIPSLQAEVATLTKLVDDLHQLSMSDEGALAYQKTHWISSPCWKWRRALFRERFASRQLSIQVSLPEQAMIFGDRDRLMQLFNNLLENSLRYTDSGGSLHITARRSGRMLVIDFADSAPGVSDEQLARLCERFYRAEGSRNRASGGSGLGAGDLPQYRKRPTAAPCVPTIRLLAGLALKLSYLWNMIYRETYD